MESSGLIIGISIGVVIGVFLAILALFCMRYHRKRSQIGSSSSRRAVTIPIRANGADACTIMSDSTIDPESPVKSGRNRVPLWLEGFKRSNTVSFSGIPEYSYKYVFLWSVSVMTLSVDFKWICFWVIHMIEWWGWLQLGGLIIIIMMLEFVFAVLFPAHVEGPVLLGTVDDGEWIIVLQI